MKNINCTNDDTSYMHKNDFRKPYESMVFPEAHAMPSIYRGFRYLSNEWINGTDLLYTLFIHPNSYFLLSLCQSSANSTSIYFYIWRSWVSLWWIISLKYIHQKYFLHSFLIYVFRKLLIILYMKCVKYLCFDKV